MTNAKQIYTMLDTRTAVQVRMAFSYRRQWLLDTWLMAHANGHTELMAGFAESLESANDAQTAMGLLNN